MCKIIYIISMFAEYLESDALILQKVGERIREMRLEQNLSQAQLAIKSGVSRGTLVNVEHGEPGSVLSLVQLLRGLNAFHLLEGFAKPARVSPIQLMDHQGKTRQRASRTKPDPQVGSEW